MTMQLSAAGAEFVRRHEGFVANWYKDPLGVGTIGVGFTGRSGAFRAWWAEHRPGQAFGPGSRMTRGEAADVMQLLFAEEYSAAVNAWWTGRKALAQNEFDAAASVVYNLCDVARLSAAAHLHSSARSSAVVPVFLRRAAAPAMGATSPASFRVGAKRPNC